VESVKVFIKMLSDPSPSIRRAARTSIESLGDVAIPHLIDALKDEDLTKEVSSILTSMGRRAAVHLVNALTDTELKRSAALVLQKMGKQAVGPLMSFLEKDNTDPEARLQAVFILGQIGERSAAEHLVKLLEDDYFRRGAADALVKIGKGAITFLMESVEKAELHEILASTLAKIGESAFEPLTHLIEHPDPAIRRFALYTLGLIGKKKAIPYLIEGLKDEETAKVSQRALKSLGESVLTPLLEAVKTNPDIGGDVVSILTDIGEAAIPAMVEFLTEEDEEMVKLARRVLVKAGQAAVNPLLDLYREHGDKVERVVIDILSHQESPPINRLIQGLQDGEIRSICEKVLLKIRDDSVVDALLNNISLVGIKNDDPAVRWTAIEILGELGDKRVVEPIMNRIYDDNAVVRETAIKALGMLGDKKAVESIRDALWDAEPGVRMVAVDTLAQLAGEEVREYIAERLYDDSPRVRKMAVVALGHIGGEAVIEPLNRLFKREKDSIVRSMAGLVLARIGDPTIRREIETKIKKRQIIPIFALGIQALYGDQWAKNRLIDIGLEGNDVEVVNVLEYIAEPWCWDALARFIDESKGEDVQIASMEAVRRYLRGKYKVNNSFTI